MPREVVAASGGHDWWDELGLTLEHDDARVMAAQEKILREYEPVAFGHAGQPRKTVGFGELVARLAQVETDIARKDEDAVNEEVARGDVLVAEALSADDADTVVEEGSWAGFTRGEATAWCWNLFQYEPHGFVHPGSEVRAIALRELREGGLPEVFGYPARARELVAAGATPLSYREAKRLTASRSSLMRYFRRTGGVR